MTRYLLLLLLVLSVPATGQTPWQPPRTPDGQPDMQGIWHNDTVGEFLAMPQVMYTSGDPPSH